MRVLLLALLLLISLLVCPALAGTPCDFSGDDCDESSTRLSAVLEIDGVERELHFASLYFMLRYMNELETSGSSLGPLQHFSMLEFRSFNTPRARYVDGTGQTRPEGYFLWTNHELPGSSFPYIAAFSDQQSARAAMDEWGGEILDGEEMLLDLYSFFVSRHGLQAAAGEGGKPVGVGNRSRAGQP